jgi:hypothetical protein
MTVRKERNFRVCIVSYFQYERTKQQHAYTLDLGI